MKHHPDLLRIATAGSVDDGKSTLVGRLPLRHQIRSGRPDRRRRARLGGPRPRRSPTCRCWWTVCAPNVSRASPSTWPTAFATPQRSFVLADTPGMCGTRNTVSGASTAQLVILLVDARNGSSRRPAGMPR